ncbi:MAG: fibrobacter succinogenes major paralogous domain-containing protein [Paludibacteraceae bacterium]
MKKTHLLIATLVTALLCACEKEADYSTPIDGDGNVYPTLQIGAQTWMLGTLHTTTYNDGTPIVEDRTWNQADATPVYCYYDNDTRNNTYMLYNWAAVKSGKLAPKGWHIATKSDWENLARTYGGWGEAGIALKAITGWEPCENDSLNVRATNESGLGLLPTGCRETYLDENGLHHGEFHDIGYHGFWWTSTPATGNGGYMMRLFYNSNELLGISSSPDFGAAVLCVKD